MDNESFEIEKKRLHEAEKKLKKARIKKAAISIAAYMVLSFVFFAKDIDHDNTFEFVFNGILLAVGFYAVTSLIEVISETFSSKNDLEADYEQQRRIVVTEENRRSEERLDKLMEEHRKDFESRGVPISYFQKEDKK